MEERIALMVVGMVLVILGIIASLIPSIARIISFPGNERLKAIAVTVAGIILIICGYVFF